MLHEISPIRQSNHSEIKRWLSCADMDLFVWFCDGIPLRFQLAFNKRSKEQVISWEMQQGFSLYDVDSGEAVPHRYKKTPLLLQTSVQKNITVIVGKFLLASERIDSELAEFIVARLMEYPR
jgi:hypothetical protein